MQILSAFKVVLNSPVDYTFYDLANLTMKYFSCCTITNLDKMHCLPYRVSNKSFRILIVLFLETFACSKTFNAFELPIIKKI